MGSKDLTHQAELPLRQAPARVAVPIELVHAQRSFVAALDLAIQVSGLEGKEIYLPLNIDAAGPGLGGSAEGAVGGQGPVMATTWSDVRHQALRCKYLRDPSAKRLAGKLWFELCREALATARPGMPVNEGERGERGEKTAGDGAAAMAAGVVGRAWPVAGR